VYQFGDLKVVHTLRKSDAKCVLEEMCTNLGQCVPRVYHLKKAIFTQKVVIKQLCTMCTTYFQFQFKYEVYKKGYHYTSNREKGGTHGTHYLSA